METVQIALTPHECDLLVRVMTFASGECDKQLRRALPEIDEVALNWLRDDIEALLLRFRGHTAP